MTTDSKHAAPIAENILARNFQASTSDIKHVGDITYIPTKQGWLNLAYRQGQSVCISESQKNTPSTWSYSEHE